MMYAKVATDSPSFWFMLSYVNLESTPYSKYIIEYYVLKGFNYFQKMHDGITLSSFVFS